VKIYPSLISADLLNLYNIMTELDDHCDGYHIDVMDDHFVPNLTWGPRFVKEIRKNTNLPIRLHLMVDDPTKWIDRIKLQKDDIFIFHHEAFKNDQEIISLIDKLKKLDHKIGVAINPDTSVDSILYLEKLDHVLVMSVNPGFSGQKCMTEVFSKVSTLVENRNQNNFVFTIGMDGGVGPSNIKEISDLGVDEVGVASAIFYEKDRLLAIKSLYDKA
jgi:ribulose-phosphate 3-epimerase